MGGVRNTDPETCRKAYEQMKEDGTLSRRRLEAVACLSVATKPPTAGEMAREMQTNRNNLATRLSELEHLGVVEKIQMGERECKVSGKECSTWQLTGKQPSGEIPKNINTTEIVRGQRDSAMKQAQALDLLLHKVLDWIEDEKVDMTPALRKKGAAKLKLRLKAITGEFA